MMTDMYIVHTGVKIVGKKKSIESKAKNVQRYVQ